MPKEFQDTFLTFETSLENWVFGISIVLQNDYNWSKLARYWASRANLYDFPCDALCILKFKFFQKFIAK